MKLKLSAKKFSSDRYPLVRNVERALLTVIGIGIERIKKDKK